MEHFGQLLEGRNIKITIDSRPVKNILEIFFEFNPVLETAKCLAKLIVVEPDVRYPQMPDWLRITGIAVALTHE